MEFLLQSINVSKPGDIALYGQIVDYLPFNITGIDTTGLYVGDAVSVRQAQS